MTGIYDMAMQGLQIADQGRERKKQRTLAELVGKAYQSEGPERQQYIGQAIGMDPNAGFAAQGHFRQMDEDMRSQVARHAQVFTSLPDEQKAAMYPQLAAEVRKVTGVNVPDVYDAKFLPMIQKLGANGQPGFMNTVQSQRVGEDGFIYTTMRDGQMVNTGIKADRQMWLRDYPGMSPELVGKDGQVRPVGGFAPQQQAPQPGNPFDQFSRAFPNVQVTSGLRTPEHNREVGGVDNSFHLTGQARDIVPPRTPQEAAQLKAWGDANGIEWINEGDHWHGEPRGRAPRIPQGMAQARPSEAQTAAEVEDAKQRTQLGYLPQQEAIKVQAAVQQKAGEAAVTAGAQRDAEAATKSVDAKRTLALLDQAEALIPESTGSGAGSMVDQIAAFAGKSTKGGAAIASLQTIAGLLTSSMPRMQGPQSDKDVMLYKQMAGDLANPNLPRETRLAALQTIREINKRYAHLNQQSTPAPQTAGGGWKIRLKGAP